MVSEQTAIDYSFAVMLLVQEIPFGRKAVRGCPG